MIGDTRHCFEPAWGQDIASWAGPAAAFAIYLIVIGFHIWFISKHL